MTRYYVQGMDDLFFVLTGEGRLRGEFLLLEDAIAYRDELTTTRTLDERRKETARQLTAEVGYQVNWNKTCFSLWDGKNRWFPLYTVAQVLTTSERIRAQ